MIKIPISKPFITKDEREAVSKQIKSGWITMGKTVDLFEKKIKKKLGVKYAILVNNGTSALHLCLLALNLKNNDEVIVPSISYVTTANVVLYCNAKPVFIIEDKKTFNIDSESILKKITKNTKAIITTDLKGMPVDYDKIKKICKLHDIKFISDSAESFGAKYKNKFVGSQAMMHSFSFFGNKNITTGEGGLITTNNFSLYKKLRILRNQGQNRRYNHIMLGNNYRMNDITASFGIQQFKKLDKILNYKNYIAKEYSLHLNGIDDIQTPFIPKYVKQHGWYAYCIIIKNKKLRDKILKALDKNNIEYRISFPPIPLQPYYKKKFNFKEKEFLESKKIYNTFIDLPNWYGLKSNQIKIICSIIIRVIKKYKDEV